jgi:hypothetical protein
MLISGGASTTTSTTTTPLPSNVCELPAEQGRCDAIKHRFAYDAVRIDFGVIRECSR